jgi:predicted membrane chloride channel (bestrophin family)
MPTLPNGTGPWEIALFVYFLLIIGVIKQVKARTARIWSLISITVLGLATIAAKVIIAIYG